MENIIYIKTAKAGYKLPVGCSQWWGNPDLPKNLEYPTYKNAQGQVKEYDFICQINLEEIARLNPATQLPHRGLLSFFAKIGHYLEKGDEDGFTEGQISSPDAVRVLYFPDSSQLEEVVLFNEEHIDAASKEMRIEFSLEQEPYTHEHGLFMEPLHRHCSTWAPPYETWKILFQLDSCMGDDFHLNLKNGGVLDFLISPEDLEKQDFSHVRAVVLGK